MKTTTHNALEQYQQIFSGESSINDQAINYFFESLSDNELEKLLKTLEDKPKNKRRKKR